MFGMLQDWKASEAPALKQLILRNVKIKSKIVAKDERDLTGKRALLNFGHTVGHAIERAGNYRKFLHGEALSLGIVAACAVSIKRAGLPPRQRDAVIDVLRRFDLPTCLPKNFPRNKIVTAVKFDKKFQSGKILFVVAPNIGAAYLTTDVTLQDIREAVNEL
jgi:3-dehydroquinate synthetase